MARMPKVSATLNHHKSRVIVVCGPTATGKTKLALALAKRLNGEIINADSRQMYQGMNVISGKDFEAGSVPTVRRTVQLKRQKSELVTYSIDSIPIWLYDVAPANSSLSISHFQTLATLVIKDIVKRGGVPILVGGTGFYLASLFRRFDSLHIPQNATLRETLSVMPVDTLQEKLSVEDGARWTGMNSSDRNNPRRLIRALEVASLKKLHAAPLIEFEPFWIGLRIDNDTLSERVRDRVILRLSSGALQEAEKLRHLSADYPAASTIGLSVLYRFLRGEISRDSAIELWTQEEIRYAKRQVTWFTRQPGIHWYDAEESTLDDLVEKDVRQWYT